MYRKLITQEMLKSNILAGSIIYTSVSQTDNILNSYFEKLNKIMKKISYCRHGSDIKKYLVRTNKLRLIHIMKKILVIAAHPDDELLGCGATLLYYLKMLGYKIKIVFLGDSESSRDKDENELSKLIKMRKNKLS